MRDVVRGNVFASLEACATGGPGSPDRPSPPRVVLAPQWRKAKKSRKKYKNPPQPKPTPKMSSDEEIIVFWSDQCVGDGDAGILRLDRWARLATPAAPAPEIEAVKTSVVGIRDALERLVELDDTASVLGADPDMTTWNNAIAAARAALKAEPMG